MLKVSVVIPTFYRNNLLTRCLDALVSQTFPAADYEIIVADDSAREATRVLVEEYTARKQSPAVRYAPVVQNHGPAAARNLAWRSSEAPLIAFTDDDCIPEPDWLEHGVAAFKPGVDGVTGRLFESGDSRSLADALLWMTSPEADLGGMGENARRRIVEEHAEGPHLERLLSVYREVGGGPAHGSGALSGAGAAP